MTVRLIKPAGSHALLGTVIAKAKVAHHHTTVLALVLALVQQASLNAKSRGCILQRYAPRTVEDVLGPLSLIATLCKNAKLLEYRRPNNLGMKLELLLMLRWLAGAS